MIPNSSRRVVVERLKKGFCLNLLGLFLFSVVSPAYAQVYGVEGRRNVSSYHLRSRLQTSLETGEERAQFLNKIEAKGEASNDFEPVPSFNSLGIGYDRARGDIERGKEILRRALGALGYFFKQILSGWARRLVSGTAYPFRKFIQIWQRGGDSGSPYAEPRSAMTHVLQKRNEFGVAQRYVGSWVRWI